ncbi:MAG: hypothetical protein QXP42_00200 [Candidatus Micrarchaeia archaeon]
MAAGEIITNLLLAVVYTVVGAVLGMLFLSIATLIVPRIVDMITPKIDDEKEMLRGNLAVATYVAQITQAVIIGMSIIIAAAVIGGIF